MKPPRCSCALRGVLHFTDSGDPNLKGIGLEEIGKIFPVIFKAQVRRGEPRLVNILAPLWPRVAGKTIAEHSRPVAFAAGTLTLVTPCASWAAQLRALQEEIRAEINCFLGGPVVKTLRVQCAPRAVPQAAQTAKPQNKSWDPGDVRVSNLALPNGLDAETAGILERSFLKYFARSGKRLD